MEGGGPPLVRWDWEVDAKDEVGKSALEWVCVSCDCAVVAMLLAYGGLDPDKVDMQRLGHTCVQQV